MDINEVKSLCKERLLKDDLKENIKTYNKLFDQLTVFINKNYDIKDCMKIVHEIIMSCEVATDRSCKVVRDITKLNDQDTCEICPFNIFCATIVKTDTSYHHNVNRICDKLLAMAKVNEITDKDREYIQKCYDKIKIAPELNNIDAFLDGWDE